MHQDVDITVRYRKLLDGPGLIQWSFSYVPVILFFFIYSPIHLHLILNCVFF